MIIIVAILNYLLNFFIRSARTAAFLLQYNAFYILQNIDQEGKLADFDDLDLDQVRNTTKLRSV